MTMGCQSMSSSEDEDISSRFWRASGESAFCPEKGEVVDLRSEVLSHGKQLFELSPPTAFESHRVQGVACGLDRTRSPVVLGFLYEPVKHGGCSFLDRSHAAEDCVVEHPAAQGFCEEWQLVLLELIKDDPCSAFRQVWCRDAVGCST